MKICLALIVVLLAEGRGVKNNGHGVPVTHGLEASHAAVATGTSHVTVNVAAGGHKAAAGAGKIVPPLVDVDTDKKFFGPPFPADYPDDISPPAKRTLFKKDSVYPKVQDEGFFDKDYVKDENSDKGQWQAQSDYDAARTKIYNEKRQAENAKKRAESEGRDVADAEKTVKERQQKEDAAASDASAAEDKAKSAAEQANEKAEKAEKKAAEKAAKAHKQAEDERQQEEAHTKAKEEADKKLKEAKEELKQEKESHEKCLKELQDAKAKVEELEALREKQKKEGVHTKMIAAEPVDLESEKAAVEEAKKNVAAADAKHQEAEKHLDAAHEAKEAAQRELGKEEAENSKAQAAVEKEEEDVKKAEKDLVDSKSKLRNIRGLDSWPAWEETPPPPKKAGAAGMTMSLAVAIAWATSMMF